MQQEAQIATKASSWYHRLVGGLVVSAFSVGAAVVMGAYCRLLYLAFMWGWGLI